MTTVGQFTVSPTAGVQVAASQIATSTQSDTQAAGLVPALRKATIISNDGGAPPTCTVTFDGTTNIPGILYVTGLPPLYAGDIVNCFVLSGTTWITEQVATASDVPGWDVHITDGLNLANLTDVPLSGTVSESIAVTESGGAITVSRPGGYSITGGVQFLHGLSTQIGYRNFWIAQMRSGSLVSQCAATFLFSTGEGASSNTALCVGRSFRAQAGDTFTPYARQNSGVTLQVMSDPAAGAYSFFSGRWISQ